MEEKEFLLKVPQGKKAEWNEEGYLQLVDEEHEQPKDITERIKTFNDACLMTEGKTEEEWSEENETEKMDADMLAFLKLRIICAALNEGWVPQFTEDEWPWYPWFLLWTEDELADKDDDWKTSHCLRAINDRRTTYAGFACAPSINAPQHSYTFYDSRLCFKRKVLADYCGHQFIDLWLDYCLPKKKEVSYHQCGRASTLSLKVTTQSEEQMDGQDKSLEKYIKRARRIARTNGGHEKEKSKEYRLMMIVSEICKMVEDGRKGRHAQRENFEKAIDFKKRIGSYTVDDYIRAYKAFVAETMEDDMANVCIRIFDMAGEFNLRLDLTEAVGDYNDFSKDFAFRGYNLLTYIVDWDIIDDEEYLSWHLSELIAALFQWAEHDGIDLNWHIERKMVKKAPAKGARDNNPKSQIS